MEPTEPLPHMPQLDALRALAFGAVAFSHILPSTNRWGVLVGTVGVQLFFVLSGFLITGILLRERGRSDPYLVMWRFYVRRALRIFPLYYAVIALGYWADIEPFRETVAWTLSYTTNFYLFFQQSFAGPISHFWTLAVEEQFYVLWPVLILFVPVRHLGKLAVAAVVGAVAYRLALAVVWPHLRFSRFLLPGSLDALAGGSLLAIAWKPHRERLTQPCLWVGANLATALLIVEATGTVVPILDAIRPLAMNLLFVPLIAAAALGFSGATGRLLENRTLIGLGRISYGLYVWHLLSAAILVRFFDIRIESLRPLAQLAAFAGTTLALSLASWFLLERPVNQLKRFVPYP